MIPRVALMFLVAAAGCGPSEDTRPRSSDRAPAGQPGADAAVLDSRPAILFIGTSLTAGMGLDPSRAYPAVIQRMLDSLGLAWQAINAGVSGETTAGAVSRLAGLLDGPVRVVVIESGANDGLRGIPPDTTLANLATIVRRIREHDPTIAIVLAGMEALPNMGQRFAEQFRQVYPALAQREGLPLIPFLLESVGGVDTLNQEDGIHPTARGQELVAGNVWRVLEGVVRDRP